MSISGISSIKKPSIRLEEITIPEEVHDKLVKISKKVKELQEKLQQEKVKEKVEQLEEKIKELTRTACDLGQQVLALEGRNKILLEENNKAKKDSDRFWVELEEEGKRCRLDNEKNEKKIKELSKKVCVLRNEQNEKDGEIRNLTDEIIRNKEIIGELKARSLGGKIGILVSGGGTAAVVAVAIVILLPPPGAILVAGGAASGVAGVTIINVGGNYLGEYVGSQTRKTIKWVTNSWLYKKIFT